jgi:hypothetical protein
MRIHADIDEDLTPEQRAFAAWLDQDFEIHVAVKCEAGQWYALLMDFDITGCGDTKRAAVENTFKLLLPYLLVYHQEGAPFAEAVRPIPRRLHIRIVFESMLARWVRHAAPRLRLASESTYALPPGMLCRFAH